MLQSERVWPIRQRTFTDGLISEILATQSLLKYTPLTLNYSTERFWRSAVLQNIFFLFLARGEIFNNFDVNKMEGKED